MTIKIKAKMLSQQQAPVSSELSDSLLTELSDSEMAAVVGGSRLGKDLDVLGTFII